MMQRRAFVVGMAAVTFIRSTVHAQQTGKMYRIGYLTPYRLGAPGEEAFRRGMRDLGYIEGRDMVVEARAAELRFGDLHRLAAELVSANVDVIVTATGTSAVAAKRVTSSIPIVMATSADAVPQGIVKSLHRPGGNVTGLTTLSSELTPKRLEILKELLPRLTTAAALWCPRAPINYIELRHVRSTAAALRFNVLALEYRETPESLADAFQTVRKHAPDALILFDCTSLPIKPIVDFALQQRLPTMSPYVNVPQEGGLVAYGPDAFAMAHRAAIFVDRILKGAKPADLPVEQPTKFQLVMNVKTARALNLTIPPSLLLRADQVIE